MEVDFKALAAGFHIRYSLIKSANEIDSMDLEGTGPQIIEVQVPSNIQ